MLIMNINEMAIYEMALHRSEALKRIGDIDFMLAEHIFKILLLPDSRDQNHWRGEVKGALRKIRKLTKTKENKMLRPEAVMNVLWNNPIEEITPQYISDISIDYPDENLVMIDVEKLERISFIIYSRICENLCDRLVDEIWLNEYISKFSLKNYDTI